MNLDKLPRWALVTICSIAIGFCWVSISFVVKNAFADMEKIKTVAWGANTKSENALTLANDLKVQITDVRVAQETFRREYREDQKDLGRKFDEVLTALKK